VRGAFTGAVGDHRGLFEEASGGTLFLDEIGDLPTGLAGESSCGCFRTARSGGFGDRAERRVDVRVVAATARDLEADVADGRFREDLYYRLNVVAIRLPPLVERAEDVPPLISICWRGTARAWAAPCRTSSRTPCSRCSTILGPEMSASSPTHWSARWCSRESRTIRRADLPPAVLAPSRGARPSPRTSR